MSPELFRKLAALGLSNDQMAGVLEIMEASVEKLTSADEERKEKNRARWHKWRENKAANVSPTLDNVSQHLQTLANGTRADDAPDLENKQTNKQENKKERATRLPKDWTIPIDWFEEAVVAGLPTSRVQNEARKMHNWSLSDRNGAKLDWHATWRNWFLRALESQAKATGPPRTTGVVAAAERILESKSNGSESIFGGNGDAKRLSSGRSVELGSAAEDIRGGISRQFARSGH